MLFKRPILDGIKRGDIDLAFRSWKKPTVSAGGTVKTPVGVVAIHSVETIAMERISQADARRAGYACRDDLIAELKVRPGTIYRIALSYASEDPRLALRAVPLAGKAERTALLAKLQGLDARSSQGPWTTAVLRAIHARPRAPARDLAEMLGWDKDWLKVQVRKLKNLGLTISHEPGYELSPRGRSLLPSLP